MGNRDSGIVTLISESSPRLVYCLIKLHCLLHFCFTPLSRVYETARGLRLLEPHAFTLCEKPTAGDVLTGADAPLSFVKLRIAQRLLATLPVGMLCPTYS